MLRLSVLLRLSLFLRWSSFFSSFSFEVVFSIYSMIRSTLLFTLSKLDLRHLSVALLSQAFLVVGCMLTSTYSFQAKYQLPTLSRSILI